MTTSDTALRPPPIAFTGAWLDRADNLRHDAAAQAILRGPGARLLRLDGLDPVMDDGMALAWAPLSAAPADADLVFLGRDAAGHAWFAAVPADAEATVAPPSPRMWPVMTALAPGDLAVYGLARNIIGWHARHRFCARCGGATQMTRAGWQRSCGSCGAEHFPRTDPVVIMTVEHPDGDALLLGRQPRFPARRYTALAGFVEPGESIEEAVAREVLEEAGVRVDRVDYVASQPWPFPSSLMIGCHAVSRDTAISCDDNELEDARWFTRAEVTAAMARDLGWGDPIPEALAFAPPPRHAIAWHLLAHWLRAG